MATGFLLDTNVLSELMRSQPSAEVMAWFAAHRAMPMYTSAITQAEILTGIALLPDDKRRYALAQACEAMFAQDFAGRCLAFGSAAAKQQALVVATRTALGRPVTTEDSQIAGIALAGGLTLVTRNTKDFENIADLALVCPWQAPSSH
jgi:predicted nucleic acid-binding protein